MLFLVILVDIELQRGASLGSVAKPDGGEHQPKIAASVRPRDRSS